MTTCDFSKSRYQAAQANTVKNSSFKFRESSKKVSGNASCSHFLVTGFKATQPKLPDTSVQMWVHGLHLICWYIPYYNSMPQGSNFTGGMQEVRRIG